MSCPLIAMGKRRGLNQLTIQCLAMQLRKPWWWPHRLIRSDSIDRATMSRSRAQQSHCHQLYQYQYYYQVTLCSIKERIIKLQPYYHLVEDLEPYYKASQLTCNPRNHAKKPTLGKSSKVISILISMIWT